MLCKACQARWRSFEKVDEMHVRVRGGKSRRQHVPELSRKARLITPQMILSDNLDEFAAHTCDETLLLLERFTPSTAMRQVLTSLQVSTSSSTTLCEYFAGEGLSNEEQ